MKRLIVIIALLFIAPFAYGFPPTGGGIFQCGSGGCTTTKNVIVTTGIDRDWIFLVRGASGTYNVIDRTNSIVYTGSDAVAAIQYAFDNLTAGRDYKERIVLKGDFTLGSASPGVDSTVDIPDYSILECVGAKLTATDDIDASNIATGTEWALFENADIVNGNHFIEIKNCEMDGNNFAGSVEWSQTADFDAIKIKSTPSLSDVTIASGSTCTLKAGKTAIAGEYTQFKIVVDTANTFKYSVNGGKNYWADATYNASETIVAGISGVFTVDQNGGATDDLRINDGTHGLTSGDTIIVEGDDLADGLVAKTVYWVFADDVNTFHLSESYAAYEAGNYMDYSDAGSGTQTWYRVQEVDRGVYVYFSAGTCDNSTPDAWTFTLNAASDILITGNTIYDFSNEAIELYGTGNAYVLNNILSDFEDDGISFDSCNNVYIKNNTIQGSDSSGIEGTEGSYNIQIVNNIVRNSRSNSDGSGGSGIHYPISNTTDQKYAYSLLVQGNIVYGNGKHGIRFINNVTDGQYMQGIIFKDNQVYDNAKQQTNAMGIGLIKARESIIADNYSYNNGDAGNEGGVTVTSSRGVLVSGNRAWNNGGSCVEFDGTEHSTIEGNYCLNNSQAVTGAREIRLNDTTSSNCTDNLILNNTMDDGIDGLSNGLLIDADCHRAYVEGNKVLDTRTTDYSDASGTAIWGQNWNQAGKPMIAEGVSDVDCGTAVTHGLMGTPDYVYITAGDTGVSDIYASSIGASTFTISCTDTGDNAYNFSWRAVYKP